LAFFLSTLFFISIGLFDDIYQLKYYTRLLLTGSILYLSISLYADLQITKLNFDFFSTINITTIAIPFTILCFLTLINSLNFYDGINGQSSLYLMFLLSYIFFISSFLKEITNYIICFIFKRNSV
jgi:UDP-GlcNAc:undecaprenyl-phosphate GlcNAc-1-phosphate transferase